MTYLFQIIRAAFGVSYKSFVPTDKECEDLTVFGKKQSILPVIYVGLKKMELTDDLLKEIDQERNRDLRRFILQNNALQKIESALKDAQIPYIPLKGAVLRDLYPSPEMRTSCDIDVLVHEKDIYRSVNIIEEQAGLKADRRAYHDILMLGLGVNLELHFSIKENEENIDRLLCRAWEFAKEDGGSRYHFTPEFQIFHIAAHMSYHFLHGGLGIRPFLDLWLLRRKTEYDENVVKEMCQQCGIRKFYEECCNLTEVWMGDLEHTETTEMLEQFCLSGSVFGSREFKNAVRQREHRGMKYILSRVLPPPSQIRDYYNNVSAEKHSLPYYYVKRWVNWGRKRKELRSQVGEIMSQDQQYIDKTYELLRRMGMV